MSKALLFISFLILLALAACTDTSPPSTASNQPTAQPQATAPAVAQPEPTQTPEATQRPTATTAPQPTATLAPAPDPTATAVPEPTAAPTAEPTPTPTLMPTPLPTQQPTSTPTPIVTAVPTLVPTLPATETPPATATPTPTTPAQPSLWRGITVAPENRCSEYDADDYHYSPSVEPHIVDAQGGIYGPYTGTWFDSIKDTDIEHIVARSEAHDSGLCAADPDTKDEFASDLLNLTLASPSVNRHQKSDKDAAEWLPEVNQCWYVDHIVRVRLEYSLTIDRDEADAIDGVLAGCESIEMVVLTPTTPESSTATPAPIPAMVLTPEPGTDVDALAMWDDNGNGRITCAEARNHGIAPVRRGHPAYEYMNDRDGDGIVCE